MSDSGNVGGAGGRQVGPMVSFTSEPVPVEPAQNANVIVREWDFGRDDWIERVYVPASRLERAEASLARVVALYKSSEGAALLDDRPFTLRQLRAALSGPSDTEEQQ